MAAKGQKRKNIDFLYMIVKMDESEILPGSNNHNSTFTRAAIAIRKCKKINNSLTNYDGVKISDLYKVKKYKLEVMYDEYNPEVDSPIMDSDKRF